MSSVRAGWFTPMSPGAGRSRTSLADARDDVSAISTIRTFARRARLRYGCVQPSADRHVLGHRTAQLAPPVTVEHGEWRGVPAFACRLPGHAGGRADHRPGCPQPAKADHGLDRLPACREPDPEAGASAWRMTGRGEGAASGRRPGGRTRPGHRLPAGEQAGGVDPMGRPDRRHAAGRGARRRAARGAGLPDRVPTSVPWPSPRHIAGPIGSASRRSTARCRDRRCW